MIMYIPIPLLWRLQTTIQKLVPLLDQNTVLPMLMQHARKLAFGLMFCAGFFIVICTLLRCVICLQTPERLDLGLNWSIRETVSSLAVYSPMGQSKTTNNAGCRYHLHQRPVD